MLNKLFINQVWDYSEEELKNRRAFLYLKKMYDTNSLIKLTNEEKEELDAIATLIQIEGDMNFFIHEIFNNILDNKNPYVLGELQTINGKISVKINFVNISKLDLIITFNI